MRRGFFLFCALAFLTSCATKSPEYFNPPPSITPSPSRREPVQDQGKVKTIISGWVKCVLFNTERLSNHSKDIFQIADGALALCISYKQEWITLSDKYFPDFENENENAANKMEQKIRGAAINKAIEIEETKKAKPKTKAQNKNPRKGGDIQ